MLGGPHLSQEGFDPFFHYGRPLRQALGRVKDLTACGTGLAHLGIDLGDVVVHLLCALRRLLDVVADFTGRLTLLVNCHGNGLYHIVDLTDGPSDPVDRSDGIAVGFLHGGHLLNDFLRRLGGLRRESLNFGDDNRKAFTRLTGSGRLDGRIQGQEIGLTCNVVGQNDHLIDALGRFGEVADFSDRSTRLILPWRLRRSGHSVKRFATHQ